MQQQHVELVDSAALEAALGRHPQVARVLLGAAQARVGEAREALGAVTLTHIEVVAHRANDADLVTREVARCQCAAEPGVGLAGAVGVSCQNG